jgi:hypothetical protein
MQEQTCSICGGPFTELEKSYWLGGGHNAQPINDGRCCGECNDNVVIPARFRLIVAAVRDGGDTP